MSECRPLAVGALCCRFLAAETVGVVHKDGWASETHADAGIVFGLEADSVLVVFLRGAQRLEREVSAYLIAEIYTATYEYFDSS